MKITCPQSVWRYHSHAQHAAEKHYISNSSHSLAKVFGCVKKFTMRRCSGLAALSQVQIATASPLNGT